VNLNTGYVFKTQGRKSGKKIVYDRWDVIQRSFFLREYNKTRKRKEQTAYLEE
jgi:hypothetical protein